ncbi:SSI family serine proteinase inhibitor [Kitasatospora sp. GP82]|uniref:SSI family serine proteinase inhibitor n=1 Tax=Kitasatospora sp. GP82 TaxID=3035089 RepID=UPI0024768801|nr:SSI family serine proteinase inhibitor [Kitasatospora sp. GP82]
MTTTALRGLLASAAVAVVAATTLGIAPLPVSVAPAASNTFLQLFVVHDADDSRQEVYDLTCNPNGDTHPDPDAACAALTAANGDFDRLAGDPKRICPHLEDPVTATVYGDWNGQQIIWQRTFPNRCYLSRATAPVF